ncbi:ZU5 domain-containing protein [Dethiosulfatibacter aminovorans DSM 17477]|uniref:ZU5 domain-containing protein n=1 Tax=Dethiosulfatibacter aminovorans DSM 17477 TaxID=1121476 RepID=A0A1M6BN76_9FIRM|nr:S-layer homology domain-containing protein [Dethiosulfatibacter aminovorans]SHI50181.1 ZU5 domain-containing protein [Dethiosulfatibacter aminovorans DSM 17477]
MFRRKSNNIISRVLVFLMVMMTVLSYLPTGISPVVGTAEAVGVSAFDSLALTSIRNNYEAYTAGTPVDAGWGNFSSYDVYLLMEAGVDTSQWEYDGSNMYDDAMALIDATLSDPESASAKRAAQDYLASDAMGEELKSTSMAAILIDRQTMEGELDSGIYAIYSNMAAYDLMAREGTLAGAGLDVDAAVMYVLNNQDVTGAWPKEDAVNWISNDFMTTVEAVRVLKSAENDTTVTPEAIELAIDYGMTWLQSNQQEDGSYISGWDDAVTDTSEMIYAAAVLGEDPTTWISAGGKSPVDFMRDYALVEGSFGNVPSTTWALDAYLQLGGFVSLNETLNVTVDIENGTVNRGETTTCSAIALDLTGESDVSTMVSWTSSNEEVATVDDNGAVTAVGVGNAEITAEYEGCEDSIDIIVESYEDNMTLVAIRNNYEAYTAGTPVDAGWGNFSSYDVYLLMEAGVDISQWEYDGSNMYDDAMALIDATLLDPEAASAKRIAQDYLAADAMGEELKSTSMAAILIDRQTMEGELDSGIYAIYSNMAAYDLMAREGTLAVAGQDVDAVVMYVLNNQDATGAWPKEDAVNWISNDFMTTVEAVRVLKSAENDTTVTPEAIELAIDSGMTWLHSNQQENGSYISGWDDAVTDTSEMIYAAAVLGEDPKTWISAGGKSPVNFMRDYAPVDGSFGNVPSTTWALDAYLQLGGTVASDSILDVIIDPEEALVYSGDTKQFSAKAVKMDGSEINISDVADWISSDTDVASIDSTGLMMANASGTVEISANYESCTGTAVITVDTKPSTSSDVQVYVAVIGQDDELLYGPRKVMISEDDEYGYTALGALDATGLDYDFRDSSKDMVDEIEGQENMGSNGWMYSVNGKVPTIPAIEKNVNSGSKILWWYSTSSMGEAPDWPSSSSSFGAATAVDEDAVKEMLEDYREELNDGAVLLNEDDMMSASEAEDLAKELEDNDVSLSGDYEGDELVLSDDELSILVPEDALEEDLEITVEELDGNESPERFAVRIGSSVYDFGPDGTQFDEPVTISITVPIDENTDLESLKPAWFDEETGRWITIPCVIDLETGMVVFAIDHFTKFAVIETEARVEFADVDDTMAWARDAVEILAGAGVINGTGEGYEPQRSITRAEFVKIVVEALEIEKAEADGSVFTDVNADDWFAQYVECGYNNDIVTGDPDGSFRPNDEISRNEIAVVLSRLGDDDDMESVELAFDDVLDIPEWARPGVEFAYSVELMNGYEDNTFRGGNALSRAEAAVVVYRYMNYSFQKAAMLR